MLSKPLPWQSDRSFRQLGQMEIYPDCYNRPTSSVKVLKSKVRHCNMICESCYPASIDMVKIIFRYNINVVHMRVKRLKLF